jgi:hypothetical protein
MKMGHFKDTTPHANHSPTRTQDRTLGDGTVNIMASSHLFSQAHAESNGVGGRPRPRTGGLRVKKIE